MNFGDEYIGIDISERSVKFFQLSRGNNIDKVRGFGLESIPPGFIKDGKIIEKEKTGLAIKKALRQSGPKKINTKKAICSVPESKVFLRKIVIPKMSSEEAEEAVKWEIEANIPLAVEQVYYDWQFLDQEDSKQNVLTVAVSRDIVDDLVETLEIAGLFVYGLEMESIATARSLVSQNAAKEETCLIVDIGGEKTSFIITEGATPYFTSSIPFSSMGVTDVISKSIGSSIEEAERVKLSQGIGRSFENSPVLNSIKPYLENLSVEIEKTVDFYQSMSKHGREISRIMVSGGGSNLKGLVPYLTTRLSREITVGDPWVNLRLGKNLPPVSRGDSVRYATAIGLAMHSFD